MVSLNIFGGHKTDLSPSGGVHVTILGSVSVRRPPLAQHLANARRTTNASRPEPWHAFFTLFGSTEITWPTLAQEYLALHEAVRSGRLTLAEWDRSAELGGTAANLRLHTLTFFAEFNGCNVPDEDTELDDLSLQRHLGYIPEQSVELLMLAVGQPAPGRLAAVRQSVAAALTTDA